MRQNLICKSEILRTIWFEQKITILWYCIVINDKYFRNDIRCYDNRRLVANDAFKMRLNSCDNVDRYLQFLTFSEFENTSFQIHYHFLKRYNVRFEKNVNLEIVSRCIFIVKQIIFVILLITSLIYTIIMIYLFVLTTLFSTFYIDIKEIIFLIFNSETFLKDTHDH